MKINPPTAIAAFVLVGTGAFMAGRISFADTASSSSNPVIEIKASRTSSRDGSGSNTAASRLAHASRHDKETTQDRMARLESILRGENPLTRSRAMLAFLDQLGPGEFEATVARFKSLGLTESRMGDYSLLLSAWAQADPLAAITYAQNTPQETFASQTILTTWANTDPDAAIRWAESQHQGDGANPYLPGIIRGLADSDPTRAIALLTGMPRSVERGVGLDFFLPHLLQQGPDATRAWIATLTDDSLRNGAMMRATGPLATTDPAGTVSWLLANPGEASQRRIDDVYSTWASQDSQAAMNSFSSLAPGNDRSNALRGMISNIAGVDPSAGISLMDRFPNDVNDRVVQSFVWQSFGKAPAIALTAISRIGDEGRRGQMYRRTFNAWKENDASSAANWLVKNPGMSAIVTPR